jgi:predicted nucleotidyltransferase
MRERRPLAPFEALELARQAARRLAEDQRVVLVYLFGSALGESEAARDVDLAILTAPALELDELLRLRADLVGAIGAPVDLISLNDASIVLAHEVTESRRCLFARDPHADTDLVTRTRARWWDWAPYRAARWRLAGERLEERSRGT